MKQVRFVVTGACERHALAASIRRWFPEELADFVIAREVLSFTSAPLADPSATILDTIDKFADAMLQECDEHDEALVIGVDDLELHGAPAMPVACIRAAVERRLAKHWVFSPAMARAQARVRERCSFHLLIPMVEAYFFGEAAALERAGALRASLFDASTRDVEQFLVDDPVYLNAPEVTAEVEPNKERRKRTWAKAIEDRGCTPSFT